MLFFPSRNVKPAQSFRKGVGFMAASLFARASGSVLASFSGAELLLRYVAVFFDRYRLFVPLDWPSLIAPV